MRPSTFSLVACDPTAGELGVAVASKFLAVGAVVPWARGGVGAVATQSWINTSYGPRGLRLLARGLTPRQAGARLTGTDPGAQLRQFGLVDARGRSFTFTGRDCAAWAGGICGRNFAAQGNLLTGPEVVEALSATFAATRGPLAERLLAALAAGQAAGGDRRGQQGAALLVVRPGGGYGGFDDRHLDLRVDDHPRAIAELARLLARHRLYFGKPAPDDLLPVDPPLARELQAMMRRRGFHAGPADGVWDEASRRALRELCGFENLEERLVDDAHLDRVVLAELRRLARRGSRRGQGSAAVVRDGG